MGCQNNKDEQIDIDKIYTDSNLPQSNLTQNDFEKQIYQTINLIRTQPKLLINQIKDIKSHKNYKG